MAATYSNGEVVDGIEEEFAKYQQHYMMQF